MKNQNDQPRPPDNGIDFGHQFDHDVVMIHSETFSTGNSPLDQNESRTNFEMTALMSQYISETEEHSEWDDQAWEAYKVMTDFMRYLAFQDAKE